MAEHTEQTAHFAEFTTQMLTLNTFLKTIGMESTFDYRHFPMSLTVTPLEDLQTTIFDGKDENSKTAPQRIMIIYDVNRIDIRCDGKIAISEFNLNKIKSLAKKAYLSFVQLYFSANYLLHRPVESIEQLEIDLANI